MLMLKGLLSVKTKELLGLVASMVLEELGNNEQGTRNFEQGTA
ncbi:MAG: hypothetical protein ABI688_01290 [Bacteroidota bacterium]